MVYSLWQADIGSVAIWAHVSSLSKETLDKTDPFCIGPLGGFCL